ncbi:MAG TPA: alcohol dehydrogenase catalytic domain-containing protein, partial [Pirellulaceae bacterium]|nr:alcohol dehydrogenase catalytic domain-containing protein [Pirellulaceae bacterium]
MKAIAVFPHDRQVKLVEVHPPWVMGPNSVKLQVLEIGICGTDREICRFHYGTPPSGQQHLLIGHEMLGRVVAVGAGVSRVLPGDLVIPMVRRPCPHDWCVACRSGRQDFCYSGDFTERGIKDQHGFMTEWVV